MVDRSQAVEEQAVRDGSAVYSVEPEIAATEEVPPRYKRTEVGVIPEDWTVFRLGDRATFKKGYGLSKADLIEDGSHQCIHYGELYTLYGETIGEVISRTDSSQKNAAFSRENDVLMPTSDVTPTGLATASCLRQDNVYLGGDILVIRPDKNELIGEYLAYAVKVYRHIIMRLVSGTTVYHLYPRDMAQFQFPAPEVGEQRSIATALSDADALIESLDRLIAKKRAIKQAAMQQLVTGQTRLPGFTGEWETKRLGDIAEMSSGGTPPSAVSAYYGGDIPWVAITDMTEGGKTLTSTERKLTERGLAVSAARLFPAGTVLYAMYASLGECSIAAVEMCSSQAILGIRPRRSLHAEFLYYWLLEAKERIKLLGQQGTQSNLNKGMVQEFRIRLPCIAEQTAIATVLSDMDTEIEALERRGDKARQIKQGMMQQLLTGRVRLVEATSPARVWT